MQKFCMGIQISIFILGWEDNPLKRLHGTFPLFNATRIINRYAEIIIALVQALCFLMAATKNHPVFQHGCSGVGQG